MRQRQRAAEVLQQETAQMQQDGESDIIADSGSEAVA